MQTLPYYEPGLYKCKVTAQSFNEASTGTPQFLLAFKVMECIEPVNDGLEKFSRTAYFPITDKTAERVMNDLKTLGYPGDDWEGLDPDHEQHHSFVGSEVELSCYHEDGQNGLRERWGVRGLGRPLDKGKLHRLNRLLPRKPVNGPPLPPPAHADGITDDDVPF